MPNIPIYDQTEGAGTLAYSAYQPVLQTDALGQGLADISGAVGHVAQAGFHIAKFQTALSNQKQEERDQVWAQEQSMRMHLDASKTLQKMSTDPNAADVYSTVYQRVQEQMAIATQGATQQQKDKLYAHAAPVLVSVAENGLRIDAEKNLVADRANIQRLVDTTSSALRLDDLDLATGKYSWSPVSKLSATYTTMDKAVEQINASLALTPHMRQQLIDQTKQTFADTYFNSVASKAPDALDAIWDDKASQGLVAALKERSRDHYAWLAATQQTKIAAKENASLKALEKDSDNLRMSYINGQVAEGTATLPWIREQQQLLHNPAIADALVLHVATNGSGSEAQRADVDTGINALKMADRLDDAKTLIQRNEAIFGPKWAKPQYDNLKNPTPEWTEVNKAAEKIRSSFVSARQQLVDGEGMPVTIEGPGFSGNALTLAKDEVLQKLKDAASNGTPIPVAKIHEMTENAYYSWDQDVNGSKYTFDVGNGKTLRFDLKKNPPVTSEAQYRNQIVPQLNALMKQYHNDPDSSPILRDFILKADHIREVMTRQKLLTVPDSGAKK